MWNISIASKAFVIGNRHEYDQEIDKQNTPRSPPDHSMYPHQVDFRMQILNMLLGCIKDSHRVRIVFRKAGGFVYLTSIFGKLEGKLCDDLDKKGEEIKEGDLEEEEVKEAIEQDDLILLLQMVSQTLVTTMRFEPKEICVASLCDTLRLVGCFGNEIKMTHFNRVFKKDTLIQKYFHEIFAGNVLSCSFNSSAPLSLSYVISSIVWHCSTQF
uniref:Uncharacterized protein n=1 Tax=Glossina palpalis gambiensis TaxID=67801 RepID=A0A1B0BKG7_9MUSC